ncbi:MAG: hypothetical protein GEEBNDBF_02035 [bacterium]|nr:hypothetical protein [bacterium]
MDWVALAVGVVLGGVSVALLYQWRTQHLASAAAVFQAQEAERQRQAEQLKSELATALRERDAAALQAGQSRERLASLEGHLAGLEREKSQLTADARADKAELSRLLEHSQHTAQELATTTAVLQEKLEQIAVLEQRLLSQQRQCDDQTAALADLKASQVGVEAQYAALLEQKSQLETFLGEAQQSLKDAFAALAASALDETSQRFLVQAEERLKAQQELASQRFGEQTTQLASLIDPVHKSLAKLQEETHELERRRVEEVGRVKSDLERLGQVHSELSQETRRLTEALKSSRARGRWGEVVLERILELSGLTQGIHFSLQETLETDEGTKLRPDCIVRLPGQREVVIDAKVPFAGYYDAVEATTEAERQASLKRHADAVQQHVRVLQSKEYQSLLPSAADFVVMFVPNDTFLAAAIEHRPELMEQSLASRVLLVTPASLMALLHVIALGWRQQQADANARQILAYAEELAKRLGTFVEHFEKLNRQIERLQETYRTMAGSFESRVLTQARKLETLGVRLEKPLTIAVEGVALAALAEESGLSELTS